jgi:ATP-dependent Lhr-like helicase
MEIGKFRRLLEEKFQKKRSKEEVLAFIHEYLYVDDNGAEAIYNYAGLQYAFCQHLPHDRKILIEHYTHEKETKIIFHTLYGRRVNDVLSRAVGYVVGKTQHKDIEIGISDNGFYLAAKKGVQAKLAFTVLKANRLRELMEVALDSSEVLKRRFRHCATRAMMILRNYMGRQKGVGRQQVSSMLLISAVKKINLKFSILREARREVLEDLMDIDHAAEVLRAIEDGKIQLQEIHTTLPSPFAFGLAFQGYMDVLKIEDRTEFLKRMHEMVVAKTSLDSGKLSNKQSEKFDYKDFWKNIEEQRLEEQQTADVRLRTMVWELEHMPAYAKMELVRLLQGEKDIRKDVLDSLEKYKDEIKKTWPMELQNAVAEKIEELGK